MFNAFFCLSSSFTEFSKILYESAFPKFSHQHQIFLIWIMRLHTVRHIKIHVKLTDVNQSYEMKEIKCQVVIMLWKILNQENWTRVANFRTFRQFQSHQKMNMKCYWLMDCCKYISVAIVMEGYVFHEGVDFFFV